MNMVVLKKLADNMLDMSFEYDEFFKFVMAVFPFTIKVPDGYGSEFECVSVKMEAIYDYYRKNPVSSIDKQLYDTLKEHMYSCKDIDSLLAMLRMVEYQISSERTDTAPFKIDNEDLLSSLKNNLQENIDVYKSDLYNEKNFLGVMQQHNEDLIENYGHRIM